MPFLKNLSLALPLLGLAACASVEAPQPAASYPSTTSSESKILGDFLVGAYADHINEAGTQANYYVSAFEQDPTDVDLARRAITSAILAGDYKRARKLAKRIEKEGLTETMTQAFRGAEALAKGKYAEAVPYFDTDPNDVTIFILANIMEGWALAGNDQPDEARAILGNIGPTGYFDLLGLLQIANLEASLGNREEAETAFARVEQSNLSPIETALSRARSLSLAGDVDVARDQLRTFVENNGPIETGPIPTYLKRLESGQKLDETLTPEQQASRALTEAAYGFFLRNRSEDGAEIYLRFAVMLDPKHDKATLWLGALLESQERYDEAMQLYSSIPDDSTYVVTARLSEANIHFRRDEDDQALEVLEAANAKYPTLTTRESLGRARLIRENYEDALPIYTALLESMSEDELKANVEPLYFRGICYERLKQWDKAVADFQRVLEIDPDNADALNYLGYTWVDRNENLEEAFDMIRRAVELEPESGAIVDSLGWAHYKLGEYEKARVQLEKAVELSPSSATIIDHLGDVYWKLGRFREAGYQWERALEYDPTDKERETIERKLKDGLQPTDALP